MAVSKNGFGKRTKTEDFPVYGRGGQGVIGMQTSDRNGAVVGAVQVSDSDEIMLISDKGTMVRTRVEEVSVQGRNTQGVRLIRLKAGESLVGLEQVDEPDPELVSKLEEQDDDDSKNSINGLEREVVGSKTDDGSSGSGANDDDDSNTDS